MEIADIFVVNKSDREGADRLVASVEAMLALGDADPGAWRPPIVRTQATTGQGVPDLFAAIEAFRAHTAPARQARRRVRHEYRLRELLADRFLEHVDRHVLAPGELDDVLAKIAGRGLDPYTAASGILDRALGRDRTR
jgi:LAO/AO transport system kinase